MAGDPGVRRYFSFLNLFTFMMLNLVLADDLVLLFLGWEGVGLCSYLLIGFWFEDEAKARAGFKAFILNRIGDAGFIVAMILLYRQFGTLSISEIAHASPIADVSRSFFTAVTLLMFLGATGKSAQIPLYVWLPDAMAGPTPVSALIHAATMVTAGVYLIARNNVLFTLAPATMTVVASIGILTAFFAATIALTQNDIKKVLAYSTISQLGYMFTAVGVGAFSAGIFHLTTHAFFKALLFLGAGSVIHALDGEQDIRNMGALRIHLPTTHWTMLAAVLAIAGIPGLSGFFSKDEILWGVYGHGGFSWVWVLGVITAGMTAFYMFRLYFKTFHGEGHWEGVDHPHESPSIMTVPLILLAFLSIFGGYIGVPEALGGANRFHHFLNLESVTTLHGTVPYSHTGSHGLELVLMVVTTVVALGGAWYAYRLFIQQPSLAEDLASRMGILYRLSAGKYFVDEGYTFVIVRPFKALSRFLFQWMDTKVVDGAVNESGRTIARASALIRQVQNGLIQHYAAVILLGVIFLLVYVYVG